MTQKQLERKLGDDKQADLQKLDDLDQKKKDGKPLSDNDKII